jgi:NAD(P)-dependent dehydrogenase (short-subunit alcohol dehydrogenase family)
MSGAALTDRVAIVFGSATGIGAACARTLAERTAGQIAASGGDPLLFVHAVGNRPSADFK